MSSQITSKDFSFTSHIGYVAQDAGKTAEFLSSFGIGPWQSFERVRTKEQLTMGECERCHLRIQWARLWGNVVLEVIQPVDSESLWAKFLETHGEGLQHIAFSVSNFDEIVSKLKGQGGKVLVGGPSVGGRRWCYIEIKPSLIVELMEDDLHDLVFPGTR